MAVPERLEELAEAELALELEWPPPAAIAALEPLTASAVQGNAAVLAMELGWPLPAEVLVTESGLANPPAPEIWPAAAIKPGSPALPRKPQFSTAQKQSHASAIR